MKDIKAIIADYELTDEQKSDIIKAVNENYKTIEEMNKKTKRIDELEQANEELSAKVEEMPDTKEVEQLKEQVQKFKDDEKKRKEEAAESKKRSDFAVNFEAALDGKEFANDIVKKSVLDQAYKKCTENTGLDAKAAIEEITKDADGVWKNPQREVHKMPSPKDVANGNQDSDTEKKEFLSQLFGKK